MRNILYTLLTLIFISGITACSGKEEQGPEEITVTISVKGEIVVDGDTVMIDSLAAKLHELGVTRSTNVRIVPDPEAGAATVEQVQRTARLAKQSAVE